MPRLTGALAAVCGGALAGCATLGAPDPKAGARLEFRIADDDAGGWLSGVMFRRPDAMRLDIDTDGVNPEGPFSIIVDGASSLMIGTDDDNRFAVKMPMEAGDMLPARDLINPVAADARMIGPCSGAGETGRLYEQKNGAVTSRLCMTSDTLMLWVEENGKRAWETRSIRRQRLDDALFAVPDGVEVIDLTTLGADVKRPPVYK